jgi:diadenosine tetraphosphate (Ap4A) HIT family hydrolase
MTQRTGNNKSIAPKRTRSRKSAAEIGPAPYHHRSDCFICKVQDAMDAEPAEGYIVEAKHFVVAHSPMNAAHAGAIIVESRRHFLDFGEMTPPESAELGSILKRLVPALKAATGAHRVYFLALMEHSPHFHLWLVPKKKGAGLKGVAYLARRAAPAPRSTVAAISRRIRERFARS